MKPSNTPTNESLRSIRLGELRAMKSEDIRALVSRIRQSHQLPKSVYHYERHRLEFADMNVPDLHSYLALLILHLRKPDTQVFSFITTKITRHRMWAIVDVDTGMIVQYNETRRGLWTFYRHPFPALFVQAVTSTWIEVIDTESGIELR